MSCAHHHRVVEVSSGISQGGPNVRRLKIRVVLEDLLLRGAFGQHFQHVFYPNAQTANARAATTLIRIDRDSFRTESLKGFQAHVNAPTNNRFIR